MFFKQLSEFQTLSWIHHGDCEKRDMQFTICIGLYKAKTYKCGLNSVVQR